VSNESAEIQNVMLVRQIPVVNEGGFETTGDRSPAGRERQGRNPHRFLVNDNTSMVFGSRLGRSGFTLQDF